jgi:hypothetical protein
MSKPTFKISSNHEISRLPTKVFVREITSCKKNTENTQGTFSNSKRTNSRSSGTIGSPSEEQDSPRLLTSEVSPREQILPKVQDLPKVQVLPNVQDLPNVQVLKRPSFIYMKNPISVLEIPIMTGDSQINPIQNIELKNWTFDAKSEYFDFASGTFINIDELGDCEIMFTGNFETSTTTFIDELVNVPVLELYNEDTLETITSAKFQTQVNVQTVQNQMCQIKYSLLMNGQITLRAFISADSKIKHVGLRMSNNGLVIPYMNSLQLIGTKSTSTIHFCPDSIFSLRIIN